MTSNRMNYSIFCVRLNGEIDCQVTSLRTKLSPPYLKTFHSLPQNFRGQARKTSPASSSHAPWPSCSSVTRAFVTEARKTLYWQKSALERHLALCIGSRKDILADGLGDDEIRTKIPGLDHSVTVNATETSGLEASAGTATRRWRPGGNACSRTLPRPVPFQYQ